MPALFVQRALPSKYSCFLCQNLSGHRFAIAFPGPVFYYAIGLNVFLWRNQAVFITVALKYNLRSDINIILTVFLFFRTAVGIRGHL